MVQRERHRYLAERRKQNRLCTNSYIRKNKSDSAGISDIAQVFWGLDQYLTELCMRKNKIKCETQFWQVIKKCCIWPTFIKRILKYWNVLD